MLARDFKGYLEGMDISKIPENFLTFPSKNVLIRKGTAYTRPGIVNDGTAATGGNEKKIVGEFVWKDALGGEKPLRALKNGDIQLKCNGAWVKIGAVTADGSITRVRFATWIDDSGDIIKKRVFFVDGTVNIYEWNGAVGNILTVDAAGHAVTISGDGTAESHGFDPGNSTAQPVQIVRYSSGVPQAPDAFDTDSTMADLTIHDSTGAFAHTVNVGDLIMGAIVTHTDKLTGFLKDDIYCYKNHLAVANFNSITVYFSNVETKLDFVIPAAASRTALSPFMVNLPQNYTAMIARYNATAQETILWISSIDSWVKVNALLVADSNDYWVSINQVVGSERLGALPMAVADHKGDIIFMSQDKTLQRITTVDVLGKDVFNILSDGIEGLLNRVDMTEMRLYYYTRYVFILCPADAITIILDTIEVAFQPPQTIGMSHISIIDGIQYGHSSARDETFQLFTGRNDLGTKIQSIFAFPYYQGYQFQRGKAVAQDFNIKSHTKIGVECRMTPSTIATVEQFFENDGSKAQDTFIIDGSKVKTFKMADDQTWASHIFGDASIGGGDAQADPLGKVYAWSAYNALGYFEVRVVFTIAGDEQEFHLLGWFIDDQISEYKIDPDLFINKPE